MKTYFLGFVLLALAACNRNNTPAKPTHSSSSQGSTTAKPAEETATVVVSGDGKVVNSTVKTKTGARVYPVTSARSFTPNQKKNLMYRFKTVPPKVLHVPDNLAKKNTRGTYYVLKGKFWYWKKADGYFYLDENYYN